MAQGNLFTPAKQKPLGIKAILNRTARQGIVPAGQTGRSQGRGTNTLVQLGKPVDVTDRYQQANARANARVAAKPAASKAVASLHLGEVTPNADVPGVTYDPKRLNVEPGSSHPLGTFVNAVLGPDLAAHVPGIYHHPGAGNIWRLGHIGGVPVPGGAVVDAASIIPIFRGPRAVLAGARALHEGESVAGAARVARASMTAPGPIVKAAQKMRPQSAAARSVQYGEHVQQFPSSPSWITAKGQRMLDRLSERATGAVTSLREGDSAVGRAAGKALTPMTARARVPKQAGKFVRQEGRRQQALQAENLRAIRNVGKTGLPLVKASGEQAAHFWYAQLPSAYRNADGLKLVQQKLSEELHHYSSGAASDEIAKSTEAMRLVQKEAQQAGDSEAVFHALGELAKLKRLAADVPERITDLQTNINKLDRLIANPPKADAHAIDALHALARDREEILQAAGKLDPERAAERTGIVSRWLGLEPTGEEAYLGHRMAKVSGSRPSGLPGGVSLGRTKLPQGVSRANTLQLVKTGRVRQSLEAAIEDWQAAQAYHFHNIAKDELARMGEPVLGQVKPGYVVINPKGHLLPRHWKLDDEARAIEEGFDPEAVQVKDLEDYVRNYLGHGADAQRLLEEAVNAGHLPDLRQVPEDVVKRYYGQFLTPKITAATPGIAATASTVGKTADLVNDALYTSLIYANPGYIPANAVANLAMAGLQQGAFLPFNLIRAGQVMTTAPQKLRDLIKAEVGEGAAVAAASTTSPLRKVGSAVTNVADNPFRISALLHEAARVGVIRSTSLRLTKDDYRRLEDFLTNPANRPLLNDVRDRAVQAMVDFERLGPMERALAKRLLFVWSWIRGATRYPFRFAADHPIRSALLAYGIAGAPGAPQSVQNDIHNVLPNVAEGMPPYLENALEAGHTVVDGKSYPQILPTRAISPISTPEETIQTFLDKPGAQTLAQMLNPGLQVAWNVASKKTPYGADAASYGDAATQALERMAPDVALAKDLINPPKDGGLYPGDTSRLGRLERAARVFPIAIDPEQAFQARVRAGMVSKYDAAEHNLTRDSQLAGMGKPPGDVILDLAWRTRLNNALRHADTYSERLRVTAEVFDHRYGTHEAQKVKQYVRSEGEAKAYYEQLRPQLYPTYSEWDRQVQHILDAQLEAQPVG